MVVDKTAGSYNGIDIGTFQENIEYKRILAVGLFGLFLLFFVSCKVTSDISLRFLNSPFPAATQQNQRP